MFNPLDIPLSPSPQLALGLSFLTLLLILALSLGHYAWPIKFLLISLALIQGIYLILRDALLKLPSSPKRVLVERGEQVSAHVLFNNGSSQPLRTQQRARISPWLSILETQSLLPRPIFLLNDNCSPDAYRRLRVQFRHP